ncbi:hypothetical protein Tco_1514660 [Tanacetum coccineum]
MEGHPYAMRLTPEEIFLVDDLSKKNVKPHDILSTIKEKNVLMALLHKKGFIFQPRVNEMANVLEDFFFAHPVSLELWHAFPQVLLLDATYKTNRAYALMNACETVFPDAKQLLCRWHISQSVFKFARPSMKSPQLWDSLDTAWKSIVLSSAVTSYLRNYAHLEAILTEFPDDDDLCCDNDVEKFKEAFKKQFTFGKSLNFTGPGPAPEENWMVMPDTGLLIASRYNRVVQYLNIRGSNTMFPLWFSLQESQRHESIMIALVHVPAAPAPLPAHAPLPVPVQVQYQQNRLVDKKRKRFKNLMHWKWDEVINLDDEEETPPDSSLTRSVKRRRTNLFCHHLCQHHVPSAATAAIISAVCQANDHGFGGLGRFSALDLYEYFEQLDLFLMVKHGCHV